MRLCPRYQKIIDDYDSDKVAWLAGIVLVILCIVALILALIPHSYILDVKTVSWEYTIGIEELVVEHHNGASYKPSDAYNVHKYSVTKSKRVDDGDGKSHTEYYTETRFDYDINKWKETRQVVTNGWDKNPYWGEYTLKEQFRDDGVGAERVGRRQETYAAHGIIVGEDEIEGSITIEISKDIWFTLERGDQLNYKKSSLGKPKEIAIAK